MVPDIIFQTLQPPHTTHSRKKDREREIYPEVCTALFFTGEKSLPESSMPSSLLTHWPRLSSHGHLWQQERLEKYLP